MKTSNDFKLIRKNDYEKLIISCWVMLIAIWIFVAISGNYLTIVVENPTVIRVCNFIDSNWLLNNLVRLIMYYFNWVFVIHAIFQQKLFKYKPILITFCIFCMWLLKTLLIDYSVANYLDFLYFGIMAILCRRKWYRAIFGAIMVFIFAFLSTFIKQNFIPNVDFDNISALIVISLYVDIYLMSYIYYLCVIFRKENNYGKLVHFLQIKQKVENYFLRIGNSVSNFFRRNRSIASIRSKAYDLYCGLVFTILTYLSLLIVGIIFDRWIEMTVSVVFFHIFRGSDEEKYHSNQDFKCWCLSMFKFIIIMRLTLPLHISYITSIAISFVLCMIMRFVYFIRKVIAKIKLSSQKDKRNIIINIIGEDNLTEEYIEILCSQKGLTTKYAETVYLYINNTLEETAELLGIDARTVSRRLNSFIEKCSKI